MVARAPFGPVVLVTGATGLIGRRVVEDLARDYVVVGLDVAAPEGRFAGADFLRCDLTDADAVHATVAELAHRHGRRVASVVHLAAHADFSGEESPLYAELTVGGTRHLLQALRATCEVEQFCFSSTLLVMRPVEPGEVIREDSPLAAEWAYPRSKIETEALLRDEHGDVPVVVLRIAGAYDEEGHSPPITQHMARIHQRTFESRLFPGDKDRGQPYVHLDDLVACIRRTVERRHALGLFEVLLVAEPDVVTYDELQDRLGELLHGREWPTIRVPKPVAKAGAWVKEQTAREGEEPFIKPWMIDLADAHRPVSIERARRLLRWEPRRRLRDVLPAMVENLRRDPAAWYERNGIPVPDDVASEPRGRD